MIATTTQFGGVKILAGKYSSTFLVGANAGQSISINISRAGGGYGASGLSLATISIGYARWRSAALTAIDNAINAIDAKHADLGASQNRFQSTIRNLSRIVENVSSACSRSRDTDFAKETVELTRAQILQQASTTILRYQTNDHLGFCPCVKANRLSING